MGMVALKMDIGGTDIVFNRRPLTDDEFMSVVWECVRAAWPNLVVHGEGATPTLKASENNRWPELLTEAKDLYFYESQEALNLWDEEGWTEEGDDKFVQVLWGWREPMMTVVIGNKMESQTATIAAAIKKATGVENA